jgi:hypothetical protein
MVIMRNFHILQTEHGTCDIFPDLSLVAFRRDKNLKDQLVCSRISRMCDFPLGLSRCTRRVCFTCAHVLQTDRLTSPWTLLWFRVALLVSPRMWFVLLYVCVALKCISEKPVDVWVTVLLITFNQSTTTQAYLWPDISTAPTIAPQMSHWDVTLFL